MTLEQLKERHAQETAAVRVLEDHWCNTFPDWEPCMPDEKRLRFWVRAYGVNLMEYAISITATNAERHWSVTRLGKYCSGVARNVKEQMERAA